MSTVFRAYVSRSALSDKRMAFGLLGLLYIAVVLSPEWPRFKGSALALVAGLFVTILVGIMLAQAFCRWQSVAGAELIPGYRRSHRLAALVLVVISTGFCLVPFLQIGLNVGASFGLAFVLLSLAVWQGMSGDWHRVMLLLAIVLVAQAVPVNVVQHLVTVTNAHAVSGLAGIVIGAALLWRADHGLGREPGAAAAALDVISTLRNTSGPFRERVNQILIRRTLRRLPAAVRNEALLQELYFTPFESAGVRYAILFVLAAGFMTIVVHYSAGGGIFSYGAVFAYCLVGSFEAVHISTVYFRERCVWSRLWFVLPMAGRQQFWRRLVLMYLRVQCRLWLMGALLLCIDFALAAHVSIVELILLLLGGLIMLLCQLVVVLLMLLSRAGFNNVSGKAALLVAPLFFVLLAASLIAPWVTIAPLMLYLRHVADGLAVVAMFIVTGVGGALFARWLVKKLAEVELAGGWLK